MHRARLLVRQALLWLICLWAAGASGHELRPALAEVGFPDAGGGYEIAFVLNLEALIAGVGPEHDDTDQAPTAAAYDALRALPPDQLAAAFDAFAPRFLAGLDIRLDGGSSAPAVRSLAPAAVGDLDLPRDTLLVIGGKVPAGARDMTFAWAPIFGPLVFRTEVSAEGEGYSGYLTDGEASAPVPVAGGAAQSGWAVFVDYIGVGFEHITPLGLDHILFVVGLFLFSTAMRPLLIQISAFTVAHTVTLALGLFGVVRVAPEIVEPLIAASIVYVAVENLFFTRLTMWRPVLVFLFGLLHGLGFAGVLAEFGLPEGSYVAGLVGFNIGVELGQLFVVGVCFVLVGFWFGGRDWYRSFIVIPGSLAIAAIGAWWVVERTLL